MHAARFRGLLRPDSAEDGMAAAPDSHDTKVEILARLALFAKVPRPEIEKLAGFARIQRLKRGETLFRRGDPGGTLLCVLNGRIRISLPSADGKDLVLNVIGPGEVFGEISLLDGGERTADATATTDGQVLALLRRDLQPLLLSRPELAFGLIGVLCERIRRTSGQVGELIFHDLGERLARTLLRFAGTEAEVTVTQRELSELVGATRESVNRRLKDWQQEGLVALRPGRVILQDRAALAAHAGLELAEAV
jgi:CRP-like cAMP-binding protein